MKRKMKSTKFYWLFSFHLHHATEQGHTKVYLRTEDSDVVVLAINLFHELGLSELWIRFRSGKNHIKIFQSTTFHKCWDLNSAKHSHSSMDSHGAMLYQQCLELTKRLHGMHGLPFLRSPAPSSLSPKTRPASHLTHFIFDVSSTARYSCTVRTVVHTN